MDRRTRILAILVGVLLAAFLADRAFASLWLEPWQQLGDQIRKTNIDLNRTKATLAGEDRVRLRWKTIHDLLEAPRVPDVQTHFMEHVGEMCDRVGGTYDIQAGPPQQVKDSDFKEYIIETKFKLTWGQLVDLLAELQNSREFLKPLRINVSSHYEQEDRLDLDLKLSTIEYSPAPLKAPVR